MKWPFVSRTSVLEQQLTDAKAQIADLIAVNEDLRKIALSKEAEPAKKDETIEELSTRPHRQLGAEIRAEFRRQARLRKDSAGGA